MITHLEYSKIRGHVLSLLHYAVGLGLLVWLALSVDLVHAVEVARRLTGAQFGLIVVLTLLQLLPLTWYVYGVQYGPLPLVSFVRVSLLIRFFNSVIPSNMSGPVLLPVVLEKYTSLKSADAVAVTGSRMGMYTLYYGLWTILGLFLIYDQLSVQLQLLVVVSAALYLALAGAVITAAWQLQLVSEMLHPLRSLLGHVPIVGEYVLGLFTDYTSVIRGGEEQFRDQITRVGLLAPFFAAFSVETVLIPGLRMWVIITGLGAESSALLFPVYMIVAYCVTVVPLTPGGVGVAEASAVLVLTALGFPLEIVVPATLLDRIIGVYVPAMLGWYESFSLDLTG